jgi:hypothetical protein
LSESVTEVKLEVRTYHISALCVSGSLGQCAGRLVYDNIQREVGILRDLHHEYRHRCDTCGRGAWLLKSYPVLSYEPVPAPAEVA